MEQDDAQRQGGEVCRVNCLALFHSTFLPIASAMLSLE